MPLVMDQDCVAPQALANGISTAPTLTTTILTGGLGSTQTSSEPFPTARDVPEALPNPTKASQCIFGCCLMASPPCFCQRHSPGAAELPLAGCVCSSHHQRIVHVCWHTCDTDTHTHVTHTLACLCTHISACTHAHIVTHAAFKPPFPSQTAILEDSKQEDFPHLAQSA